jgi:hydrophobe/amphiphile efflux-3 (HAE3) family protein
MKTYKENAKQAYLTTLKKMTPVIVTAMITTALGFISLQASPVPMIRDFGIMLFVGVIISFLLMFFVLSPLLFIRDYYFYSDTPKKKKKEKNPSKTFRFLKSLIKKSLALRGYIMIGVILVAGYGFYVDQDATVETDVETFMPQSSQALEDIHTLRDRMDSSEQLSIIYSSDDVLDEDTLSYADSLSKDLISQFEGIVDVRSVTTLALTMDMDSTEPTAMNEFINNLPEDQAKTLINDERNEAVITIMLKDLDAIEAETFLEELNVYLSDYTPNNIAYKLAGQPLVDVAMISALTYDRYTITFIGLGLVFLSLLILYRSLSKALFPLIPVILLIGFTSLIMHLLSASYTPLTATLGALTIGIAVDFSILVMERVREERTKTTDLKEAIGEAVSKMLKPITVAALTTMGGFSVLLFSDFQILNNFGIMTVITLGLALLSVLLIMPSFLYLQATIDDYISRVRFMRNKKTSKQNR